MPSTGRDAYPYVGPYSYLVQGKDSTRPILPDSSMELLLGLADGRQGGMATFPRAGRRRSWLLGIGGICNNKCWAVDMSSASALPSETCGIIGDGSRSCAGRVSAIRQEELSFRDESHAAFVRFLPRGTNGMPAVSFGAPTLRCEPECHLATLQQVLLLGALHLALHWSQFFFTGLAVNTCTTVYFVQRSTTAIPLAMLTEFIIMRASAERCRSPLPASRHPAAEEP